MCLYKKSKRFLLTPVLAEIIAVGMASVWTIGSRKITPIDNQED